MTLRKTACILALALFVVAAHPARAQLFGDLEQDATGRPADMAALGMANAGVALIDPDLVFSYNPAQLGQLPLDRLHLQVLGLRFGFSPDIFDKLDFIQGDLQDAIDTGIENLYEDDRAELEALYDQARGLAEEESVLAAQILLPQAFFRAGPVNVGIGAYLQGYSRVQFSPDLVPVLDAYGQTEFILPVAVGYRVPGTAIDEFQTGGLSVGGTIRYIRRQVTAKQSPIDALDDTESLYFFRGSGLGLDIGAHYEEVLPNVNAGLAIFNLIGGGVDLNFEGGRIPFDDSESTGPFEILFGVSEPTDASPLSAADSLEFQELEARFAERSAAPIVRLGAAYDLDLDLANSALSGVSIALDYTSRSTSEFTQPFGAHWRLGVGFELVNIVHARAGYAQGYPALGVGIDTRFAQFDYAFFSVEDGRLPGQLRRSNHRFQMRFGLF
ncbi:MAG: hypothetical protein AAFQ86_11530 [Bacteroidota bacterium]